MLPRYEYRVFKTSSVISLLWALQASESNPNADSFVAMDTYHRDFMRCLSMGYRWVRTDGEYVVLEKEHV